MSSVASALPQESGADFSCDFAFAHPKCEAVQEGMKGNKGSGRVQCRAASLTAIVAVAPRLPPASALP
eukprot:2616741-Prymnesium_polylepis.3